MDYILSSTTGIVTARNLGSLLNYKVKRFPIPNEPPKIRWGNDDGEYKEETKFNDPQLIKVASNKVLFSKFTIDNRIRALTFRKGVPESYPIFIRKLLNSYAGKGIVVVENEEQYKPLQNFYYSYYKPFSFELRVHVLGGEVVKIFKKMKDEGEEAKVPIRNIANGYHFGLRKLENYPKAIQLIEDLYKVFPIQLAGIDMGFVPNEGYYIIEINTCPSLNDETIKLYADFLKENIK